MAFLVSEHTNRKIQQLLSRDGTTLATAATNGKALTRVAPFEITANENGTYKGKRLFYVKKSDDYEMDGNDILLYNPTRGNYNVGDKLFCVFRGVWEIVSGGGTQILLGTLAATMTPDTLTISVTPDGEENNVTVKFPQTQSQPPRTYKKQSAPAGTLCRYYADGNGYTMLDIDCVPEDEEDTPEDEEDTPEDEEDTPEDEEDTPEDEEDK